MEPEITIIGRYNSSAEAYVAASLLKDHGIECAVNGEDLVNVMPLVGGQITLSVRTQDAAQSRSLLGLPADSGSF